MSATKPPNKFWGGRKTLGDHKRSTELAAFLPAALEIQETPPNPIAKWLGRSLITLFTLAMVWAALGEIDIVATAEGKIIPSARIKQIQPMQKAVVKKILVHDGQKVQKGQALIELDATLTGADQKRVDGELTSEQSLLAVHQSFLQLMDESSLTVNFMLDTLQFQVGAAAESAFYKRILWSQWQDYQAQLAELVSSQQRNNAMQAGSKASIVKYEQTIPIIRKRTAIIKDLYTKGFSSETDYLKLEQELIQLVQDLESERQNLLQLKAAQDEVTQQVNQYQAQSRMAVLGKMTDSKNRIAVLQEELNKAMDINARQILYSPVTGQVQQLSVNTIGGVVTEAQNLMVVVPTDEQLEVEVQLPNKDIGFVQEGMLAEIKIHTFPFTQYGVVNGMVLDISNDAIITEDQGLVYRMRVKMDKATIDANGRQVNLIPGMAVTVEVKTSKRKIIEFFIRPAKKYASEGLRER